MKKIVFVYLLFSVVFGAANAQSYYMSSQEVFGKNRVQSKRFEWKTIRTSNFEFNYYRGGDELAKKAAVIAETEFGRITDVLGYTPFATMKIFIYNSSKDLKQSNIGLTAPIEFDGGILNLSRSRVELPFGGDEAVFKKELVRQIANLFVYDMLYGGSLKEVLQTSLMLSVPDWYLDGIARYISNDNTSKEEIELMKAMVLKYQNKKIGTIKGEDAAIIGQSIWNYIAVKYGQDNISNILNLTRIIRAEESSLTSTLGISYNRFLKEWREFYINDAKEEIKKETKKEIAEITQEKQTPLLLREGEVDTENYSFAEINVLTDTKKTAITNDVATTSVGRLRKKPESVKISEPRAYQNLLLSNDFKGQLVVDPVRRGGIMGALTLNDLLENHVLKTNFFVTHTLRNHDINVEYINYKKKMDWGIHFERRSIYIDRVSDKNSFLFLPLHIALPQTASFVINRRLLSHQFSTSLQYPISNTLRVEATPFLLNTTDINYEELTAKNLLSFYGGVKGQVVFDNTKPKLGFLEAGTKAKVRLEKYAGLNNKQGFNRMIADIRHYQPLINGIVLAGRFSYSTSTGNAPKTTFLGGTENWINRQYTETDGQVIGVPIDMREFLFYNFAGNLRGFQFGRLNGNSHILTNLELRVTLANYLKSSNISSRFLQNLQVIGFNDIGTAWKGNKGPFTRQNSLNTEVIGGGTNPFRATVTNFKNPFLMGYGIGIRSRLLNHIVRIDYAWGMEDKEVLSPMLHLSLGRDF